MKSILQILSMSLIFFSSCSQNYEVDVLSSEEIYFPPNDFTTWETINPESLLWNVSNLPDLKSYLENTNTKAFIILKDGKIAIEYYFDGTTSATPHPWNSAGKTLTSFVIGMAEKDGLLSINDATTKYLGEGWTAMTAEQEIKISLKNQLTMTTGGDYNVKNESCTDPECLEYLNEPGTFWYYHNAFYTVLQDVIDKTVPNGFNSYFRENLKNKIGMSGTWIKYGYNHIYFGNARSMARFGLLNLNKGNWKNEQLITENYFQAMTNTSQPYNNAYGYLWWLNGKESFRLPTSTKEFTGKLIPNAPDDLVAGLGKNDQKLYVVPSKGLVIIRLGDSAGNPTPGPSGFDNELWEKLNAVLN